MKEFTQIYPELVEKYTIQYPIDDKILKVMPVLHKIEWAEEKPDPKKIRVSGSRFERLLKVWEYFHTFSVYLSIPEFRIEDLEAAIRHADPSQPLGLIQTIITRSVHLLRKLVPGQREGLKDEDPEELAGEL